MSYEATVSLGEPMRETGECALTPPAGTGTVPVTITLVDTNDESRQGVLHRASPIHLEAEPMGGNGPLRWYTTAPEGSVVLRPFGGQRARRWRVRPKRR
ncbi:hypothetical protein GCM10022205_58920 [Spinactinospora alkalitolerans]